MICFCLAYQCFGVLVQPISWSDCWICIGIPSFLAMSFIKKVFLSLLSFIYICISSNIYNIILFFFQFTFINLFTHSLNGYIIHSRSWEKKQKAIYGSDFVTRPSSSKTKSSTVPILPTSTTVLSL